MFRKSVLIKNYMIKSSVKKSFFVLVFTVFFFGVSAFFNQTEAQTNPCSRLAWGDCLSSGGQSTQVCESRGEDWCGGPQGGCGCRANDCSSAGDTRSCGNVDPTATPIPPTATPTPAGPTNLSKSCSPTTSEATFSWIPVSGVTNYILRISKEPAADWFGPGDQWVCVNGTSARRTIVQGSSYNDWSVQSSRGDTCKDVNGINIEYGKTIASSFVCGGGNSNLLTNGGFEDGMTSDGFYPVGWIYPSWGKDRLALVTGDSKHTGSWAIKLWITDDDYVYRVQWVNVSPGTSYTLSAWGKKSGDAQVNVRADEYQSDGTTNISKATNVMIFAANTWEQKTVTFTTNAQTNKIAVVVQVGVNETPDVLGPATSFYVDDISLVLGATEPTHTPLPPPGGAGCAKKAQGDANCDGSIDGADYVSWLNRQCTTGCSATNLVADFNGDSRVDDADYTIWFNNRQQ